MPVNPSTGTAIITCYYNVEGKLLAYPCHGICRAAKNYVQGFGLTER